MYYYWIYGIIQSLFWPIIIIGLIYYFFRRRRGNISNTHDKNYLGLALSREDAVSQLFLLLSVFFLGVTLLAFNRDFGDFVSWRSILLLVTLVGLFISYYFKAISILLFSLIGVIIWWGVQATQWIQGKGVQISSLLVGLTFIALLYYLLGHLHRTELKTKRFGLVYLIYGITFVTGVLFFLASKLGLLIMTAIGSSFFTSWQITFSLFLFLIAIIGLTLYLASKKYILLPEAIAVFILTVILGITALLPPKDMVVESGIFYTYYSGNVLSLTGILWVVILNSAVFFELLGLIFSGYLRREEWLINLGTLFLFLLIIVKYFDWFSFLDKSLFFIGAGILLFVVGWFMEKGRRYVIGEIKTEQGK